MNLSRMVLSGFIMIYMASAFAEDITVNPKNNNSNTIGTMTIFNVSRPSIFSSSNIDQVQTAQQFNARSRDPDRDQLDQVRRENLANVNHSFEQNSNTGAKDYFLANNNLGKGGYIRVDNRNISGDGYPVGPADDYDLNGFQPVKQSDNNPQYVYYKQSVTVVNPNSPLYTGLVTPVTTGQQVANRNANQNVLFFCTAGNRAQTAEAFKQAQSADLSVWTDLESFNKCKAWAVKSENSQRGH